MANLVLELRAGEMMVVNGAPIHFRTRARIELAARARFLFGKQIMGPGQANTPARRIYYALQIAYIGAEEERAGGLKMAQELIDAFKAATTSKQARDILDSAIQAAMADDCYQALKLARRIIRHEDAVLGRRQTETVARNPGSGGAGQQQSGDIARSAAREQRAEQVVAARIRP